MTILRGESFVLSVFELYYAFLSDVSSMQLGSSSSSRKVNFNDGSDWSKIDFSLSSSKFSEKVKREKAGVVFNQNVDVFVAGDNEMNFKVYDALIGKPFLLKVVFSDGKCKVIGNLSGQRVRLLPSLNIGGKSGRLLKFSCKDIHQAYFLEV